MRWQEGPGCIETEMARVAAVLFVAAALLWGGALFASRPDLPKLDKADVDSEVVPQCLIDVYGLYRAEFLTYSGTLRAWALEHRTRLCLPDDGRQQAYLRDYARFEAAVRCYDRFSGNYLLNLRQSPTEFAAAFNTLAEQDGVNAHLQ